MRLAKLQAERRTWPLGALFLLASLGKRGEGNRGNQTGTENITEPKSLEQGGMVCRPVTAIRAGGALKPSACRSGAATAFEREPSPVSPRARIQLGPEHDNPETPPKWKVKGWFGVVVTTKTRKTRGGEEEQKGKKSTSGDKLGTKCRPEYLRERPKDRLHRG